MEKYGVLSLLFSLQKKHLTLPLVILQDKDRKKEDERKTDGEKKEDKMDENDVEEDGDDKGRREAVLHKAHSQIVHMS